MAFEPHLPKSWIETSSSPAFANPMRPSGPQAVAGDLFGVIRRDQWDLKEHSGVANCVRHSIFGHRVAVDVGEERKVPVETSSLGPPRREHSREKQKLVP